MKYPLEIAFSAKLTLKLNREFLLLTDNTYDSASKPQVLKVTYLS